MATEIRKARNYLAQYQALSNAAAFIGTHGEEGFSFEDDRFNNAYLKMCKKLSVSLEKRSEEAFRKYKETGIEINDEISEHSH